MESDCPPATCCLGFVDTTKDELIVKLMSDVVNLQQKNKEKDNEIYNFKLMLSYYQVKEANTAPVQQYSFVSATKTTH